MLWLIHVRIKGLRRPEFRSDSHRRHAGCEALGHHDTCQASVPGQRLEPLPQTLLLLNDQPAVRAVDEVLTHRACQGLRSLTVHEGRYELLDSLTIHGCTMVPIA